MFKKILKFLGFLFLMGVLFGCCLSTGASTEEATMVQNEPSSEFYFAR